MGAATPDEAVTVTVAVAVQALTVNAGATGQLPAPAPFTPTAGVCNTPAAAEVADPLAGTVAATVSVAGVVAVALAVDATPLQEFICDRQSVPEKAVPARFTQVLNWWVQAWEAAEGRSTKTSSRTRKPLPLLERTDGGAPPRERVKMKKVTTSVMTVVVAWVEIAEVARELVEAVVELRAVVVATNAAVEVATTGVEATVAEV